MKRRSHIALAAALALLCGTVGVFTGTSYRNDLKSYANQFGDINGDGKINASDAALILQYSVYSGSGGEQSLELWLKNREDDAELPETPADTLPEMFAETDTDALTATEPGILETVPDTDAPDSLEDDPLTILCWNNDLMAEIAPACEIYAGIEKPEVICLNCPGSCAREQMISYFNSGDPVDLYLTEPDWIRSMIDDPSLAVPLSELGIYVDDYADAYPYAVQIGMNGNGTLMAAAAEIAPGFYAYNTDYARQYLGVETPEEMQAKISDWDKFEATAEELKNATGGTMMIADTLGGMWRAFSSGTEYAWVRDYELQTGQGSAFIRMGQRFIENGYIDPKEYQWTDTWQELGAEGRTLGYFYSSWTLYDGDWYSYGQGGNWNIVRGPHEFFWGGSYFCVAPQCDSREEAARFLRAFTIDDETMYELAAYENADRGNGSFVCNNRKAMQRLSGGNSMLGGQDPFPILDEVAGDIYYDCYLSSPYDFDLKYYCFLDAFQNFYDSPESEILEIFNDHAYYEVFMPY